MPQLNPPANGLRVRIFALSAAAAFAVTVVGAGPARVAAEDGGERPGSIVVTTEVLGAIVGPLVGDAAEVVVLMDGGTNPHTFEPSARDAERILSADVLVSNGLDLEDGLLDVLESASAEGVTWFEAADYVATRGLDPDDEADEDGHEHAAEDPHIWTDPLAMRDVVAALGAELADVGIDVTAETADLMAELEALDAEVSDILSVVAAADRKLVTGHRSMGYFADRYGFEQIGTVIPSLSTNGEPTARELAQLITDINDSEVTAVFAEIGTPRAVAEAVAGDSGTELVTLSTSQLPEDGTYASLVRDMATTVAGALGA